MALLISCGGGADETGDSSEAPADVTLESLDLAAQVTGRLPEVAPPSVPDGMSDEVYAVLVDTLREWATASTVDPRPRESEDPLSLVVDAISHEELGGLIEQVLGDYDDVAPRLLATNRIAPDVTVVGDPAVEVRWKVGPVTRPDGTAAIEVMLQTLAAYQVELEDGAQRVVGVVRNHVFRQKEGEEGRVTVAVRWQEFGAESCDLSDEDVFGPSSDADKVAEDLDDLVEIMGAEGPYDIDGSGGQDIDSATEGCASDAA